MSAIEWTHFPGYAGATLNPWRGCSHVSEGCRYCYAERLAGSPRLGGPGKPYAGTTRPGQYGPKWTGDVKFHPHVLDEPLRTRKPTAYFVSMSDPFHEKIPFTQ